jgi:hypothetical protein
MQGLSQKTSRNSQNSSPYFILFKKKLFLILTENVKKRITLVFILSVSLKSNYEHFYQT